MMDEKNLIPTWKNNSGMVCFSKWPIGYFWTIILSLKKWPIGQAYQWYIASCYPKEKDQKLDNSILDNNHHHPWAILHNELWMNHSNVQKSCRLKRLIGRESNGS